MVTLALLVEGNLDETVGRRIVEHAECEVSTVYGKKGVIYIKKKIDGFNRASISMPMLALTDLMDTRFHCPPDVIESWLPHREKNMLFRVVVREIESWLLADRRSIAAFLKIPLSRIPDVPEDLPDPKLSLINLARKSRSASMRRLLVPSQGSTATEGPAYTSEMQRFVRKYWDIDQARKLAPSLDSCIKAVFSLRQE